MECMFFEMGYFWNVIFLEFVLFVNLLILECVEKIM